MTTAVFKNESVRIKPTSWGGEPAPTHYGFDRLPRGLFLWSGLLQKVVSQAVTYILSKKFHSGGCGIYKYEGGCRIDGREMVLRKKSCCFNYGGKGREEETATAKFITELVLAWNPMTPVESMLDKACELAGCQKDELVKVLEKEGGGPFGGDALNDFFSFGFSEREEDREYERYCLEVVNHESKEDVDTLFADRDLSKRLLGALKGKAKVLNTIHFPMCCEPRRNENGLLFWINTGTNTNIDGWKSQEFIETFLDDPTATIKEIER